jgi:phospholipase C
MWDNGKMDGGDLIHCGPNPGTTCPTLPVFQYVYPSDVGPYFFIAEHYGFANRMFQSQQGPSFPAHQFIISGTSQPSATTLFFSSNNPTPNYAPFNGCDAPVDTTVSLIGPRRMASMTHPCFEHATLTDLIDNPPVGARQGISWRYYTPTEGIIWNGPAAIRHMCQPQGAPPTCQGPDWSNGKEVINQAQVLTDIAQNNLASVSWVIPNTFSSDHARYTDGTGPSWVASIVNAIGESPYWNNTVILITWDDWGGWYDHVPPPIDPVYGYYENGFRVPLLVVSPWTPAGYVSQPTHTFGSILKFIEEAFGLPLIPPGDMADSRSDDLSDFFNFSAPPRTFVAVPAPLGPDHFLSDQRPRQGPDDD